MGWAVRWPWHLHTGKTPGNPLPTLFRGLFHKDFSATSCLAAQRPFQAVGQRITSAVSCRARRLAFHEPLTAGWGPSPNHRKLQATQICSSCKSSCCWGVERCRTSFSDSLCANSKTRAHNVGTALSASTQRKLLLTKISQQPSCVFQSRKELLLVLSFSFYFEPVFFFNSGNKWSFRIRRSEHWFHLTLVICGVTFHASLKAAVQHGPGILPLKLRYQGLKRDASTGEHVFV